MEGVVSWPIKPTACFNQEHLLELIAWHPAVIFEILQGQTDGRAPDWQTSQTSGLKAESESSVGSCQDGALLMGEDEANNRSQGGQVTQVLHPALRCASVLSHCYREHSSTQHCSQAAGSRLCHRMSQYVLAESTEGRWSLGDSARRPPSSGEANERGNGCLLIILHVDILLFQSWWSELGGGGPLQ